MPLGEWSRPRPWERASHTTRRDKVKLIGLAAVITVCAVFLWIDAGNHPELQPGYKPDTGCENAWKVADDANNTLGLTHDQWIDQCEAGHDAIGRAVAGN